MDSHARPCPVGYSEIFKLRSRAAETTEQQLIVPEYLYCARLWTKHYFIESSKFKKVSIVNTMLNVLPNALQ